MEKYEQYDTNDRMKLKRKSPELWVEIQGKPTTLTWYNTVVQLYAKPYQHLSHIEHQYQAWTSYDQLEPERETLRVFSMGDIQNLMAQRFPMRLDQEPTDEVANVYLGRQQEQLSNELDNPDLYFGDK